MRSVSYRSVHAKLVIESPRFGLVFNQFRRFSALSATTIEGKQMCKFCEEQGLGTDPLSENRECSFKHEKAPYGITPYGADCLFPSAIFWFRTFP